MSSDKPEVRWNRLLKPYRQPSTRRSTLQLITAATLFGLVWWLMLRSLAGPYYLTLLLAPIGAGLQVRLFAIFHDCVHDSFYRSPVANRWVGRVLGVLTLTPFRFWRRNHLLHHATSGNLDRRGNGDVNTLTVKEYLASTPLQRWGYRFARHPLVFLSLGPTYLFVLKHRLPIGMPRHWRKEWLSILWNNLATVGLVVALGSLVGYTNLLLVQGPIWLLSATFGVWLFFVQHQFEQTYWSKDDEWDYSDACLEGSSYLELPQPIRWFTAGLNVHHIHHLSSAIPNYRLEECYQEVAELPRPRRMTLRQSLRCGRLALWDEERRKLIRFRDLPTPPQPVSQAG